MVSYLRWHAPTRTYCVFMAAIDKPGWVWVRRMGDSAPICFRAADLTIVEMAADGDFCTFYTMNGVPDRRVHCTGGGLAQTRADWWHYYG